MDLLSVTRVAFILFATLISSLFAEQYVAVSAKMSPVTDLFVCVGGSFELNCTVYGEWKPYGASDHLFNTSSLENETLPDPNSLLTVSNISITHGRQSLERGVFTYHPKELTLQLNMDNVTKEDAGSYFCYYHNTSSKSFKSFKIIKVGEPPWQPFPPVCVSYSFLNMTCYVHLNQPRDNIPYNWTMKYKTAGINGAKSVSCQSEDRSDVLACVLPVDDFFTYETYMITIIRWKGDQQMCNTSTEVFTDFSIVKPDRVQLLRSKVLSSSSARLKWIYPKLLNYRSDTQILEYDMLLQSENDWDNRKLSLNHKVGPKTDETVVHGLVCNSVYHFAVRSRPTTAADDVYWSQWSNTTFHTKQNVPNRSTELSSGSYFVIDDGDDDFKTVVLYWKNPQERYWCGKVTGYLLDLSSTGNDKFHSNKDIQKSTQEGYKTHDHQHLTENSPIEIQGFTAHFVLHEHIEATKTYQLKMFTVNNQGQSNDTSVIEIPSWTEAWHARVRFVSVEMSEDGPRVSWEIDKKYCGQLKEVTYYWCRQAQDKNMNISYALCKDSFDWLTVPVYDGCNADNSELINSTKGLSDMRFAVSVNVAGVTGGMVWEKFRFTYDAVPSKPQYQVSSVPDKHTELEITLLYNDYYNLEEGGQPDSFNIVYIESANSVECSEVTMNPHVKIKIFPVDFSNQMMTIGGLEPGTSYAVCGWFRNNVGEGGYGKLQLVETTIQDSGNTDVIVIAVVFGILAFVLGIIGFVFLCRRVRGYISTKQKVDVPNIDLLHSHPYICTEGDRLKENSLQKSDWHDSGQGSDSPNSSLEIDVEGAADSIPDSDIKETTPILPRAVDARRDELASSSDASRLSGYLRVSEYGGMGSDDDLISCSEDDIGETNCSFSQKEADQPETCGRKQRVDATITMDDIKLNLDTQGSAGDMLEDLGEGQNMLNEEEGREVSANPMELSTLPQDGNLYVAAVSTRPGEYSAATVQSGQAGASAFPNSHATCGEHAIVNTPLIDETRSTGAINSVTNALGAERPPLCSPALIGENTDTNTVDVSKAEEANSIHSENSCNSGSATNELETHIANSDGMIVVESEAHVESEADVSISFSDSEVPSQVNVQPTGFAVNNNTDIFSDMFDDIMDATCGFGNYQNPDTLSLGQMSILSNGSDADSKSIKSFTSTDKAEITEPMDNSVMKNSVLKLCNEINSQFDKHKTSESNDEMADRQNASTVSIRSDQVINSTRNVSDSAIFLKSQALRELHDKVDPEVPSVTDLDASKQESGGPCVEVYSYVKAGLHQMEEDC